jgi:hypothetical protein
MAIPVVAMIAAMLFFGRAVSASALTVDFEDLGLSPESYNNGADGASGFTSRNVRFPNLYDTQFGTWFGWSYSNTTDTTTAGPANQYSAMPGAGSGGSATYAVAFFDVISFFPEDTRVELPPGTLPVSMDVTNTVYAALSMRDGDGFAKAFGGSTGSDPDFLRISVIAIDADDEEIASLDVFLADYRFENSADDYILDAWRAVDLSPLADENVVALDFRMDSSDSDPVFGMNTPAYFAMDNLVVRTAGDNPLPGDLDGDATVTRADAARLLSGLGTAEGATFAHGDLDGDRRITLADLAILQANLGRSNFGAPLGAAVPEPSAAFVLAATTFCLACSARVRRMRY